MCGIVGATGADGPRRTASMVAALGHRGPDAEGISDLGAMALGHTRLRIIDLSPQGDQPMANPDGSVHVAFNGEIYNFQELRAELRGRGHVFASGTDTEVIIHLYEELGDELVHRLRGMFAFALWDGPRQRLLLVRDRLGIKPLYLRREGADLAFASEVRALGGDRVVSASALASYLALGWVAGPGSILHGIEELPPGHLLVWEGGRSTVHRWWQGPATGEQVDGSIGEVLADAVARHLVADVPVGIFLSSGIDSALVAGLSARVPGETKAFTVAFDGEGDDESVGARAIADHIGLDHHVVTVPGTDVLGSLDRIIADMDQPTVDGVNSWVISRAVRDAGIVVALSGLGGDELFRGYSTFQHVPRIQRVGNLVPRPLASALASAVESMPGVTQNRLSRAARASSAQSWEAAYAAVRGTLGSGDVDRLWPVGRGHGAKVDRPWGLHGRGGTVAELELANYLPYQLLRDTDAMSMAHSLEVRVPLLDDSVVALAGAGGFALDKQAMLAAVPSLGLLTAGPKRTFTLPFAAWIRGPLRERSLGALASLGESDLGFDRRMLTRIWDGFLGGQVGWRSVWGLSVLGMWLEHHAPGAVLAA